MESVERRYGRLEALPNTHGVDPSSETDTVVGLHQDPAEHGLARSRGQTLDRKIAAPLLQGAVLVHADHAVVVASHAEIGDVASAASEQAVVRSRHVGVGTNHQGDTPIQVMCKCQLLTG